MKNIVIISIFITLLIGGVTLFATTKGEASGKILKIEGKSAFVKSDGKWKKLKEGDKVFSGVEIKTGNESKVILLFNDSSELRVSEKSQIKINDSMMKSAENRKFAARLVLGRVWAKVAKSKSGDRNFELSTKTATAGVRGTTFDISFDESEKSIVSLYNGSVEVDTPKTKKENQEKIDKRNYDKRNRKEVSGPKEVSLAEWNRVVLKQMQRVTVAANGETQMEDILPEEKDEWVLWNQKLDAASEEK
ncbi:FecR domain-containing protein [bacterium]|nr:FecR domain-containing protein [bacterium]